MPTASGGHQSEWTTISNQCYAFAAVVAVYNHAEPGRSGLLSESINVLVKEIMCTGKGLREFHEYRLRLLRCGITWQSRANTTTRPINTWLLTAPNQCIPKKSGPALCERIPESAGFLVICPS
jgi:hypothetical protein